MKGMNRSNSTLIVRSAAATVVAGLMIYASAVLAANPAPTITFTADHASVNNGKDVKLTWSASNAVSCTASSAPDPSIWSGPKPVNGSVTIFALSKRTTFTLTCSNVATCPVELDVLQPTTVGKDIFCTNGVWSAYATFTNKTPNPITLTLISDKPLVGGSTPSGAPTSIVIDPNSKEKVAITAISNPATKPALFCGSALLRNDNLVYQYTDSCGTVQKVEFDDIEYNI